MSLKEISDGIGLGISELWELQKEFGDWIFNLDLYPIWIWAFGGAALGLVAYGFYAAGKMLIDERKAK